MKQIFLILFLTINLFASELINISFKDLNLMELIKISSEVLKKDILVANKIEGKVDFISHSAVNKDKLLYILKFSLEDNGYRLIKDENIYRVIKLDDKKRSDDLETTKIINLINVDAKDIENILKKVIESRAYIKNRPSISINEKNNSLILDGSSNDVYNLTEIIKELDIPNRQVYVKASIVEVNDNLVEEIGLKYGILGGKILSGNLYTFSSSLNEGSAITIDTGSLGLEIPNVKSSLALGVSLNLLNRTYALDVISQPSILCLNNIESLIYVGETVSIQTASTTTDGGTTKNSFNREDIGLTLKVKPRISDNNRVSLEIHTILEGIKNINYSSLNPDTSKKEIKTKAIVNNGESVILGGLLENRREKNIQKIPIAGDIPLIGELFKNRVSNNKQSNLMVIITPYVVPKNRDITYVINELSKLKSMEDKFLEKLLIDLKSKKEQNKINKNKSLEHEEQIKKHFGFS